MSAVIVVNALLPADRFALGAVFHPTGCRRVAAGRGIARQPRSRGPGDRTTRQSQRSRSSRHGRFAGGAIAPQPVSVRRDDPIADLIAPQPSPRVTAVQRALSEYGYGQIKPTGVVDEATSTAIQKFEREHKLPVTGRVSERLVSQLTALVGHPLN